MFSYFKNDLNNIFKNLLFLQIHKMIFIIIILYIRYTFVFTKTIRKLELLISKYK